MPKNNAAEDQPDHRVSLLHVYIFSQARRRSVSCDLAER